MGGSICDVECVGTFPIRKETRPENAHDVNDLPLMNIGVESVGGVHSSCDSTLGEPESRGACRRYWQ